jgi:GT2 family glycosyltransferase
VDNASSDGTQDVVRAHMASNASVKLHELPANIGFAAANNAGAKIATGEYLVLLNSDTIVTSGWLGRLVRHLQLHTDLGLLCPVTNFAGNEAMIEIAYVSAEEMQDFAQERARINAGRLFQIEVAPLFCAILGRKLWSELGGLDERFQVGMFEDDDFSCQVRRRGLRVAAAEDCFVHHFGQGSFAKLPRETYEEVFRDNRRRFEEKWKTAWKPHQTRPGVKPAFERTRFLPATFCDRRHQNEPSRHVHPRTN